MRKRKIAGPIEPLSAYARLGYECQRCKAAFVSKGGPEIFCEACRRVLRSPQAIPQGNEAKEK